MSNAGSDRAARRPRTVYLLNQANQAIRSRLETALREVQITGIQYTVLSIAEERKAPSSAELSRRFFVTPQTMNEIVAGLERRGLIERREDKVNRRILRVALTAEGRSVVEACHRIADRIEQDAFDWLPESDYEELRRVLRQLLTGVRERWSE